MAGGLSVLITGGLGFLGLATARCFKAAGARVIGIGHGAAEQAIAQGFDRWLEADVSLPALEEIGENYNVVVHCASTSSVQYSFKQPQDAYERTVSSLAVLLDYLRRFAPNAVVLYPSSAAVYGAAPDRPLRETDAPNPVSPYGFHKQMAETLLAAYTGCFGLAAIAIRFFSIYGPGLHKQLMWDASRRLVTDVSPQTFFGSGDETRDWIHVEDAAGLIVHLATRLIESADYKGKLHTINGAAGERVTVRDLLSRLAHELGSAAEIHFDGRIRTGDPRFYHAAVDQLHAIGWRPAITLDQGIADYAHWIKTTI